jgi:general secretion pathway protein N
MSPPRAMTARRWGVAGALLGALLALPLFAPASWLGTALARASQDRLLLAEARGSLWQGSGVLVLTGGAGSRDASQLPGRLQWQVGLQGLGLLLTLRHDCCLNGEQRLLLTPGWGRLSLSLPGQSAADWLARWPAAWLGGLGTPWNTLQLGGGLRLSASSDFGLDWAQGRWQQRGRLDLDLVNLSSRISTLDPLGNYRFSISTDPATPGVSNLRLSTLDGALQLSGEGLLSGQRLRLRGEARAAEGREAALNNLLNVIGRRQGARSVISIG